MRLERFCLGVLGLWLLMGAAWAHKASDSYLSLEQRGPLLNLRWDIALRDLDLLLDLDRNADQALSWGELRQAEAAIDEQVLGQLQLSQQGRACSPARERQALAIDQHTDGPYAVLQFRIYCHDDSLPSVDYRLLAGIDSLHRGLLSLRRGEDRISAVLSPGLGPQALQAQGPGFRPFLYSGVEHLLSGYDHILFLLSLLLPACLCWREGQWQACRRWQQVCWDSFAVVTAFTLAHSLTLGLAVMGWLSLPAQPVEAVIAFSVLLAALHNLWPRLHAWRWRLAFAFGLVHGLGFAGVLDGLPLERWPRLVALAGFNIGVELGQLALVVLVLPLLWWARRWAFYRERLLPGLSLLIAALALVWLWQRLQGG